MSTPFQISLAPDQLWQAINPMTFYQQGAQFGLINIDLGDTAESDLERKILDRVGSYGASSAALATRWKSFSHVKLGELNSDEQDALDILRGSSRRSGRSRRSGAQAPKLTRRADSNANPMIKAFVARPIRGRWRSLESGSLVSDPDSDRASWGSHMASETIDIGGLELRFLQTKDETRR
jgi:hypothetical protein